MHSVTGLKKKNARSLGRISSSSFETFLRLPDPRKHAYSVRMPDLDTAHAPSGSLILFRAQITDVNMTFNKKLVDMKWQWWVLIELDTHPTEDQFGLWFYLP
jgi:hypothetical protein